MKKDPNGNIMKIKVDKKMFMGYRSMTLYRTGSSDEYEGWMVLPPEDNFQEIADLPLMQIIFG